MFDALLMLQYVLPKLYQNNTLAFFYIYILADYHAKIQQFLLILLNINIIFFSTYLLLS